MIARGVQITEALNGVKDTLKRMKNDLRVKRDEFLKDSPEWSRWNKYYEEFTIDDNEILSTAKQIAQQRKKAV